MDSFSAPMLRNPHWRDLIIQTRNCWKEQIDININQITNIWALYPTSLRRLTYMYIYIYSRWTNIWSSILSEWGINLKRGWERQGKRMQQIRSSSWNWIRSWLCTQVFSLKAYDHCHYLYKSNKILSLEQKDICYGYGTWALVFTVIGCILF